MLFTPSMSNTDIHYHIELSLDQVKRLSRYLDKQIFEVRKNKGKWKKAQVILAKALDVEPDEMDKL